MWRTRAWCRGSQPAMPSARSRRTSSHVLAVTREHERARQFDLVDFVHFLAGTGARHSEALALRWDDVILADDQGEPLAVGEVRIRGTKTARSDRFVAMREWLTTLLRDRAERSGRPGSSSTCLADGARRAGRRSVTGAT